jgi:hypothetical protein
MKPLAKLFLLVGFLAPSLALIIPKPAQASETRIENVSQCFRVRQMTKSEDVRYFVDATSHCSREYDAVYVQVSFLDGAGKHLDDGVWAIYWCRPGRRETHEFGIPERATGFERVVLRRITTDLAQALGR